MAGGQLSQPVLKPFLVLCPLAGEEYEAVEHHACSDDWYVFYRLLEDDVEVAMHAGGISDPPEVYPVSVYLVAVNILKSMS